MCSLDTFKIDLKALKDGETVLQYRLRDDYFEAIDASEVRQGDLSVTLSIQRTSGCFEFRFHIEGTVTVPCDLCLDDMLQPIATDNRLLVKFGDKYNEDDELVTVPEDDGTIDTSWLIYEFIALGIPIKHVHETGKCNVAMTQRLKELSAARSSDEEQEHPVDPRWDALSKLKQKN